MTGNALHNIEQIEASLWEAADQLRANSKLTSSEYSMPVLGVIFLRHAANRYYAAKAAIEAEQAAGKMPMRALVKADFVKRRAMMLPTAAQFDELLKRPKGATLEDLTKATDWQAHSVRGFLSGTLKKRMGLTVLSEKDDKGTRRYRIQAGVDA